ncbi:MAG: hypothetical protein ACYC0F_18050 [Rhodanobacter sp.]
MNWWQYRMAKRMMADRLTRNDIEFLALAAEYVERKRAEFREAPRRGITRRLAHLGYRPPCDFCNRRSVAYAIVSRLHYWFACGKHTAQLAALW